MKLSHIFKDSIIEEAKKVKKPSSGLTKKQKSAVSKKAKAGKDIGKKGKGFEKVAKSAGGGEKGKKIAAAAMWKNIKRIKEASNLQELSPELRTRATDKALDRAADDYLRGDTLSAKKRVKQSATFSTQVSPAVKTKIENIFKDTDFETEISKGVDNVFLKVTDRGASNHTFGVHITKDKYNIEDPKSIMKKLNDDVYQDIIRKLSTAIKLIQKEDLPKDTDVKGMDEQKDPEGQMAKVQLKKIAGYADKISKDLKDESQLDAWVQDHIAKASELMDQVGHFMDGKK